VRNGIDEFDLTRLRAEPRWPGRKARLDEALDWGDYRLSVFDEQDRVLLFRTGFDSNVDPGSRAAATTLSIRLPLPQRPLRAAVEKRRAGSTFQLLRDIGLDPADGSIDRSPSAFTPRVDAILVSGPSPAKADIAIVAEGYASDEYPKFVADANRAASYLFSVQPFAARMRDFNVYSVFTPSTESGATDAYLGVRKDTAFRSAYGTDEAERILAVRDHHALCEAASAVPYDFLLVIVNARRYGGSAYFGGPAVVAIDSGAARYLVIHEFAHVIGGLADEYYIPARDGPVYRGNVEPWHPNVTLSPEAAKWQPLRSGGALELQRWNKAEYDGYFADYVARYSKLRASGTDESVIEQFMAAESGRQAALLAKNGSLRQVGFFEGAAGYARGMFRSEVNCNMFSLQTDYFCAACTSAIERMIGEHTG